MTHRPSFHGRISLRSANTFGAYRRLLLTGVSLMALLASGAPVRASSLSAALAQRGTASATASATAAATTAAQQAATITSQVNTDLGKASSALKAALAQQAAAATAAAGRNSVTLPGGTAVNVTDGLSSNGLVVDPRVLADNYSDSYWANLSAPVQTTAGGQTTVTLTQTSQRAIATWQQFNVGKNTTVTFDQSAGNTSSGNSWVVLNRIDATGVPSAILGTIKAEGTVLVINPNGIIFGAGSQINVHSLIAASMDFNYIVGGTNVGALGTNGIYVQPSGYTFYVPPEEANANASFLTDGLYANNGNTMVLSTGVTTGQTNYGITVEPGATITAGLSGADNGGTVALLGPNVTNLGVINAASGQIILGAGNTLWISEPSSSSVTSLSVTPAALSNNAPDYQPAAISGGALVTNGAGGVLSSADGAITLAGDSIEQLGVAEATTSITRTGSITLTAGGRPTAGNPDLGLVQFGPSSVTAIVPDEDGETIPGSSTSTFVAPSITINAASMDMAGSTAAAPGALIVAPSAVMTVSTNSNYNNNGQVLSPSGRVLLESGSVIDLGGIAATANVSDYLYTFKVTANDVADTPLAQDLIGQTVTIDLRLSGTRSDGESWVGSPLFASSGAGYLGDIAVGLDQLLAKGGSLTFTGTSSGWEPFQDVITAPGSFINVSGGTITYTGAPVSTTNVVSAGGAIVNIGSASPFVLYTGLAGTLTITDPRWGVADTYATMADTASSYQDPGYTDGISGGAIGVTAANPVLEGAIDGGVYVGSRQAELADTAGSASITTPDAMPAGASLSITAMSGFGVGIGGYYTPGDVILLQSGATDVLGADFTLTSTLTLPAVDVVTSKSVSGGTITDTTIAVGELVYSTDLLSAADLGSISISSGVELSMAEGSTLSVRPGGSITLAGADEIDGSLVAHAGKITIIGYTAGTSFMAVPPVSAVTIGPDALLDVSGLWVNDNGANAATLQGAAYINGGSVTVETYAEGSYYQGANRNGSFNYWGDGNSDFNNANTIADTTQSIILAAGSVIDLSSGGYVGPTDTLKTASSGLPSGTGGSLSLLTYAQNPGNSSGWLNPNPQAYGSINTGGNLAPYSSDGTNHPNQAVVEMDGTIYSAGLAGGGTFSLQAPIIQIGGVSTMTAVTTGTDAGTVALPASFFSTNGFSAYSLTSTYGSVTVTAGTTVLLQSQNYLLPSGALPATGASLRSFATLGLAPNGERQAVNLTLTETPFAFGVAGNPTDASVDAGVLVDAGAMIIGQPGAAVALVASGPVTVLGSIVAPGGDITLTNDGTAEFAGQFASGQTIGVGVTQAPLDVWIGPDAVLDVAGTYVPNPSVTAYSTGSVLNGGAITISGGTVVAMPGSTFDLAGASATVQELSGNTGLTGPSLISHEIWSNGGTLTLEGNPTVRSSAYQTLYFDGTIDAAGGAPSAAGGTLVVGEYFNGSACYDAIIVTQSGEVTNALNSTGLTGTYPTTAAQLQGLLPNTNAYAYLAADTLNDSGLDSVGLIANTIAFSGNVMVKVPDALTLAGNIQLLPAGNLSPTYTAASIGGTTVTLDAGYILLASNASATPAFSDGTLDLNASTQIDLAGWVSISNAANVDLNSGGDIRLLAETDPQFASGMFSSTGGSGYFSSPVSQYYTDNTSSSVLQAPGLLAVPDNLTLTAREVYPSTDSAFLLLSTGMGTGSGTVNTITIASNGRTPVVPYSVDGEIAIDAATILQDGVLWAPLGTIQLGLTASQAAEGASQAFGTPWYLAVQASMFTPAAAVTTQSLTLASGSLTSVSAAGLDLPYGYTVNDVNWTAIGGYADSTFNGTTYPFLAAPPAKNVVLNGTNVTTCGPGVSGCSGSGSALIDLAGGGDIYATEFVPGTGGSRNVLDPGNQTVYALVPAYEAAVAAADAPDNFYYTTKASGRTVSVYGQTVATGSAVTLSGGDGIAAGTYVLLPAIYATMPGAYRVVMVSANTGSAAATSAVAADGSIYMTGALTNAITGAKSSQTALFEIQPQSTWTRYTEIDITPANSYFASLAAKNGTAVPILPIDGGALTIDATGTLTLHSTNDFTPASGGRGGMAAITGTDLLVVASDLEQGYRSNGAYDGYVFLDADQISDLGATTVLIGGTFSQIADGTLISSTAANVVVATDAGHPLTAPNLLLTANPAAGANVAYMNVDDPNWWEDVAQIPVATAGIGVITVASGSVVQSRGVVPSGNATVYYLAAPLSSTQSENDFQTNYWSGNFDPDYDFLLSNNNPITAFYNDVSAAILQVSNGAPSTIVRPTLPTTITTEGGGSDNTNYTFTPNPVLPAGTINIGDGVQISGGNALNINGGNVTLGAGATISGSDVTLGAAAINLGNAPSGATGLTLSPAIIGQLAGDQSVTLQSASTFNFYGDSSFGSAAAPIGTLTLDGAGFVSDGGTTTLTAANVVFQNSQSGTGSTSAGGGALAVDATNTMTFGTGTVSAAGLSTVDVIAGSQVLFSGSGGFNAGAANVSLTAPAVVVDKAASQALTTTGTLAIAQGAGTAPTLSASDIGGSLTLTAATIADSGVIVAQSGTVTLEATGNGGITLSNAAAIEVIGTDIALSDESMFSPGGTVKLVADAGNVSLGAGTLIDVSAAVDASGHATTGMAGTLDITAAGNVDLEGALKGGAKYDDLGGNFVLSAGSQSGSLPFASGFTAGFAVTLAQGDITVPAGTTLTSGDVVLTANDGSVVVDGTIDASGPTGGTIALYGAGTTNGDGSVTGGLTITSGAQLLAMYRADAADDPLYGNGESTLVQNGGTITLGTNGTPTTGSYNSDYGYENVAAANAGTIKVESGATLDVSGGPGGADISNNGGTIVLRAPILEDDTVNVRFAGTVKTNDQGGPLGGGVVLSAYAVWSTDDTTSEASGQHFDGIIDPAGFFNDDGTQRISADPTTGLYPSSTYANPAAGANTDHIDFYQHTLVDFVQTPFGGTGAATIAADDFSGASLNGVGATGSLGTTLHLAPEIDLVNPDSTKNGGNITVASNWNLGAGDFVGGVYTPTYRTKTAGDAGEAGILTLRAANNVQIDATISDGFYETADPFYVSTYGGSDPSDGVGLVANQIANNPQVATNAAWGGNTVNDYNTTSAESLMTVVAGLNDGSFTYDFVAGADGVSGTPSVNPNAVISVAAGTATTGTDAQDSVTVDGHTSYASANTVSYNYSPVYPTIDIPTLVRTGTGSITITAAGSFELLDTVSPGVVYTAGAATTTLPADYTAPALPTTTGTSNGGASTNGMVSTPSWATNGGAVTITVGSDIVGIEAPTDNSSGSQTLVANDLTGEFWSAWYFRAGLASGETAAPFDPNYVYLAYYGTRAAQQNTTWINYGTFFQGVGALGGGNVVLKAGGDVDDISVSLPETIQVSGGQYASGPAATAHYYGGGDLIVQAGGNLYSSTFYVGRGSGDVRVGGAVASDPSNPVTGTPTTYYDVRSSWPGYATYGAAQALPLLLAVQDGFISIVADGSVSLGGVFDPTAIPQDPSRLGVGSITYDNARPLTLTAVTPATFGATFQSYGANSGVALASVGGDVGIDTLADFNTFGSAGNGSTTLFDPGYLAQYAYLPGISSSTMPATLEVRALIGNISFDASQSLIASPTGTITLMAGGSISTEVESDGYFAVNTLTMLDGTTASTDYVASLLGAPIPSVLSQAWHADDPNPVIVYAGADIAAGLSLIKPAQVYAGDDILNMTFTGQNNTAGDVTSIIAGNDIMAEQAITGGTVNNGQSLFQLYGPGTFLIEAGRDLGPFFTGAYNSNVTTGIITVGDGSNCSSCGKVVKSYLPVAGADVITLFGVGPGIDYAAAISQYVDPANAGADGIDYLALIAGMLGETKGQAWPAFQALAPTQQDMLVDQAFLQFLSQVGLDYNDKSSPYYGQYARAYDTIATLFPASLGYTDNKPKSTNGAAATVSTGDFWMAESLLETQTGGNIAILGPGGNVIVGINATDSASTQTNAEGVLTLQGGSILTYTDQSVEVYQSRILTEQGGDIDMFTANGDLNAGKGPNSSTSYPPLTLIWDVDGYSRINPAGLVTGAGVGALLTLPGQNPALSNANLMAPRGTVDAGAAGIRVANNLNIVALQVLNAFNISVGGTATGVPMAVTPNIGALTAASTAAGQSASIAEEAARNSRQTGPRTSDLPSIITVEVIGYGGENSDDNSPEQQRRQEEQQRRLRDQHSSYDPNGSVRYVGAGLLSDTQRQSLTPEERSALAVDP